jgi:hypothetical protein
MALSRIAELRFCVSRAQNATPFCAYFSPLSRKDETFHHQGIKFEIWAVN